VINVRAGDLLGEVKVYTLDGKCVDKFTLDDNQASLNLSSLIAGIYFVEATTQSGQRVIQQIIKR